MAEYGYPSHPLYLPWGFDPSLLVSPDPIFPPYPQDFAIPAGYGWIPGPMTPIFPHEFDLAFLSPSYCRACACFLHPYAYHYPPPPAPPPQPYDAVHLGIPLLPGLPVAPGVQPPHYLQPLELNVSQTVAAGTGVFHPPVMRNNNNAYRGGRRRGQEAGRWRGNRQRREEEASRDARVPSQINNTGTTSSQERR